MAFNTDSKTAPAPYQTDPRIESGPEIIRNDMVEGYEVNNLILAVD